MLIKQVCYFKSMLILGAIINCMETILGLMPLLQLRTETDRIEAVVRMCIAHVLNDNEYSGVFETAAAYLRQMNIWKPTPAVGGEG